MQKFFIVLTALTLSINSQAQQDTVSLQEAIVTANKYEQKQNETAKVITVINKEQLSHSNGRTLGEILSTVAGTNVIGSYSNLGTNQTISIRGASTGNTLVLIDGIPVNDPSAISNYYDINFIPTEQIERIEILKGGQSTLYGSDAVAGVVNIITKKAGNKKLQGNLNYSVGSYDTHRTTVNINGANNKSDYSLTSSGVFSKGFSTAKDTIGNRNYDKDGFAEKTVRLIYGHKTGINSKLKITGSIGRYKSDVDDGAYYDDISFTNTNKNVQLGAGWTKKINGGNLNFNYQYNKVQRIYIDDSLDVNSLFGDYSKGNYLGTTHFIEVYQNKKFNHIDIIGGIDFRTSHTVQNYYATSAWGPYESPELKKTMNQLSAYASSVYKKNNFLFESGLRVNKHSNYGTNLTFTLNPAFSLEKNVKLFANIYSSFKSPTLYQLFDPIAGNRTLDPEKNFVQEFGIELNGDQHFKSRVVAFNRNSKNTIMWTYTPMSWDGSYLNASKQTNYGVEVETKYVNGKTILQLNYTYTDGKTTSKYDGTGGSLGKDTTYFNLWRIPKNALHAQISTAGKHWFVSLQFHLASKRYEYVWGSSPSELTSFTMVDASLERRFGKNFKWFLQLNNLTNTKFEEQKGYNTKGFNYTTGFSWKF